MILFSSLHLMGYGMCKGQNQHFPIWFRLFMAISFYVDTLFIPNLLVLGLQVKIFFQSNLSTPEINESLRILSTLLNLLKRLQFVRPCTSAVSWNDAPQKHLPKRTPGPPSCVVCLFWCLAVGLVTLMDWSTE